MFLVRVVLYFILVIYIYIYYGDIYDIDGGCGEMGCYGLVVGLGFYIFDGVVNLY